MSGTVQMSDMVEIIKLILAAITPILLALIPILSLYIANKQNKKLEEAAEKVKEVKSDLKISSDKQDEKMIVLSKVADATHILVNNNMAIQLKLNAELSRWKANETKNKADIQAADRAEQSLKEHEMKQNIVDGQSK